MDIYDCRTRAWYMEAAASPKDVIILVDRSGSMTGQRRDIAKHVVTNILDTLGNNDFVNVMTFADTVEEIVPCFEDSLVQVSWFLLKNNEKVMFAGGVKISKPVAILEYCSKQLLSR